MVGWDSDRVLAESENQTEEGCGEQQTQPAARSGGAVDKGQAVRRAQFQAQQVRGGCGDVGMNVHRA
eukprot:6178157-Pleurochrysis_carterae.AAC.1